MVCPCHVQLRFGWTQLQFPLNTVYDLSLLKRRTSKCDDSGMSIQKSSSSVLIFHLVNSRIPLDVIVYLFLTDRIFRRYKP